MPKLYITNIFLYLNKKSNHKNNDPQQSNIVIQNIMFHKWMFSFNFVEMELEPCNFFNAPYLLEIYHVMTFNSICEMKLVTYHNIVMWKNVNNPFNLIKISLKLYCH
jgi:hypothetical protein